MECTRRYLLLLLLKVKRIVNFILSFHWKIYHLYCSFIGRIICNDDKTNNSELAANYLFDPKYNERKKAILNDILKANLMKKKKSSNTESEIYVQQKSGETLKKKKKIDKHFEKTSLHTMYDNFFSVTKKEDNTIHLEVLRNTKNKMINSMMKFTNNLVNENNNNKP